MRPIDADALIKRMYHDAFETDTDMQKWDSGCWIRYKMFENAIDEQPTIEPKHGKWKINNNGWAYCPECGSFGLESYSFCPYCGTKLTDKNIFVKGIDVPNKTYESKWIPCKKRLPNESGEYLVCPSDKELEAWSELSEVMIIPYDADCEAFGWWTDQYDPITFGYVDSDFNDINVLAWMPLPTTYKEGV